MLCYPAPVNSSDSSDVYQSSRDVSIYTSDCFLVARRYDDKKGYRVLRPAPTGPLRLSAGYKLKNESPALWDSDRGDPTWQPKRVLKDPLPKHKNGAPQAKVHELQQVIDQLQKTHDAHCELLQTMGRDACDHRKKHNASSVYNRIKKGSTHCELCGKGYESVSRLKEHVARHMGGLDHLQCPVCDKKFASQALLTTHKATHVKEARMPHHCAHCKKGFPSKSKFNEHNKQYHPDPSNPQVKRKVNCKHCKKPYSNERNLQAHEEGCGAQPKGQPRFGCFFCPSTFSARRNRNVHSNICGDGAKFDPKKPNIVEWISHAEQQQRKLQRGAKPKKPPKK